MSRLISSSHNPNNPPVVIPDEQISIHEVTLPEMPIHRLKAALAGALEEQLLDDPAELHFALAPNAFDCMRVGKPFEVMVCNKAWLQNLLNKWQAQGQSITTIWPQSTEKQQQGWNLAQFDFRAKPRWNILLNNFINVVWHSPEWRWARLGALLLIIVQIVGLNTWAWRDRALQTHKREQIKIILQKTYPEIQVVIDAPEQMSKALARDKALRGTTDAQSLESQLAKHSTTGKTYSQLDFINGELKLTEAKPD